MKKLSPFPDVKVKYFYKEKFLHICLLKYSARTSWQPHKDPVDGYKLFCFNILLKGEDVFFGECIFRFWRFSFFRPDKIWHGCEFMNKNRMVLSIGWRIKE